MIRLVAPKSIALTMQCDYLVEDFLLGRIHLDITQSLGMRLRYIDVQYVFFIDASTYRRTGDCHRHFITLLSLLHPAFTGANRLDLPNSGATQSHQLLTDMNAAAKYANPNYCRPRTTEYVVGENLGEGDRLRGEGYEAEANESYESGVRFSELAANYARNFEVYCK